MNVLTGNIKSTSHYQGLALVETYVNQSVIKTILIDADNTFNESESVNLLFKPTEVAISKKASPDISIQNQLESTIISIDFGELLSQVQLSFGGQTFSAIITSEMAKQLNISPGITVFALIKINAIMLSKS